MRDGFSLQLMSHEATSLNHPDEFCKMYTAKQITRKFIIMRSLIWMHIVDMRK